MAKLIKLTAALPLGYPPIGRQGRSRTYESQFPALIEISIGSILYYTINEDKFCYMFKSFLTKLMKTGALPAELHPTQWDGRARTCDTRLENQRNKH